MLLNEALTDPCPLTNTSVACTETETSKDPVISEEYRDLYPFLIINSLAIIVSFFHCPKGSSTINMPDKYIKFRIFV